jgi:outer membrane protein OmpA-like peptidoglycan-associated protein
MAGKAAGSAANVVGDVAEGTVKTGKSLMKWLLPALLALLAIAYFGSKGCNTGVDALDKVAEDTMSVTENAVGTVADAASDASTTIGDAAAGTLNWTADALKGVFSVVDEAGKAALSKITLTAGGAGDQMVKFIDGGFNGSPIFRFNNLNYKTGSAEIEDGTEVDHIAAILKAYPNVKIEVRGHTDNTGDAAANVSLSDARANSVRGRLIAKGIAGDRIRTKGYGQDMPMATNDTEEGRALNRRIEVVVVQ